MKSSKRNAQTKMKKGKKSRETIPKQITALGKQGKIYDALKAARGWELDADPAYRIVEQWQAVGMLEKNPKQAPADFYEHTLQRAAQATWNAVRRAVLSGDGDFFLRIAERLKQAEPVRDEVRLAVLADKVTFTPDGKSNQKTDKEIAFDVKSDKNPETILREVRRFRRQIEARDK